MLALLLWLPPGLLLARRLPFGADLRLAIAPLLGWSMQSVVALNVSMLSGFSVITVVAVTAVLCIAVRLVPICHDAPKVLPMSAFAFIVAALVAIGPALSVLPKITPDGVALAAPIYDHSKIALIDEMVRTGVPPANPFIGGAGAGHIAYYYFWLFGAAQLALLSGASGWEADVAATWFTAFAALLMICGLAFHLSGGRRSAVVFVFVAALCGSLRPVIDATFGSARVDRVLETATGFGGFLLQASWSPHHVAAGASVVVAILLLGPLARRSTWNVAVTLGLVVAMGCGSSLWVGGFTFCLCAFAAGLVLWTRADVANHRLFVVTVVAAAALAIVLVAPLLLEQLHSAALRGETFPVRVAPYVVLSSAIPDSMRRLLDVPAYWLVLLPIEFPAVLLLGIVTALRFKSDRVAPLTAAALASFCASSFLTSTVGDNNDLGWRAVLPGLMILMAFAGAGFSRALTQQKIVVTAAGLLCLAISAPDGLALVRSNAIGERSADAQRFADAPALWAAVREHTATDERIASNPRMTSSLAPWDISLSWALLAHRRSCYAGDELVLAFAPLSRRARAAASGLFDRVFAGTASAADVTSLKEKFHCRVIVLTPKDGAWARDPFATDATFRRVAELDGKWRIYRADR